MKKILTRNKITIKMIRILTMKAMSSKKLSVEMTKKM
jgi:hypothetical protein